MKVTIETSSLAEWRQLLTLLQALNLPSVVIHSPPSGVIPGDKTEDPTALFGMWQDRPRTLSEIRAKGWDRNA